MPLPMINVTITGLADAQNGVRPSGTFEPGRGNPAWVQTNTQGDIDVTGAPDQGPPDGAKVTVAFTLADNLNLTFPSDGFVPPDGNADFQTVGFSNDNKTMSVSDTNNEARFTQLKYGLKFSDNTTLDPRMINR